MTPTGTRLKDKVAIVTGGGSGFGAGIAAKFVAEGAQVLIADRDLQAGLDVAARLGPAARAAKVDVSDAADVRLMFEAADNVQMVRSQDPLRRA